MSLTTVDGKSLTLDRLVRVAGGGELVRLSSEAEARIRAARDVIEKALKAESVIYGVTTGFGKLSDVLIPHDKLRDLQINLLRSHACGVGEPLPEPVVRGAMLLRANSLAKGFSGVRLTVVEFLLQMLNLGVHPLVPSRGSVGASGDLAPSAHMALVMIGEGEALYRGERLSGGEALRRAGLEAIGLEAKEGLSLLNGTQFIASLGGLATDRASALADAADIAGALSTEVLLGTPSASDPRIHAVRHHPGQERVARRIQGLLRYSEIVASHRNCGRVQDAYSLRCIPQVHGAVHDALDHVADVLEREFNSATDNPLVFAEDGAVISGGNFHGAPLAHVLDYAAIVLTDLAGISERRLERLVNPDLSGLPPFLAPEPGLTSGYMMLQVTAAALVSECKVLAHPASVDSIPTSASKEDHVSMGMTAALKLETIVDQLETVLACEILASCQAMEYRRPLKPGVGTGRAYALVREVVPPLTADRPSGPDIGAVRQLIRRQSLNRCLPGAREAG